MEAYFISQDPIFSLILCSYKKPSSSVDTLMKFMMMMMILEAPLPNIHVISVVLRFSRPRAFAFMQNVRIKRLKVLHVTQNFQFFLNNDLGGMANDVNQHNSDIHVFSKTN